MTRKQIALAGNPNTGKTSLFNRLTGARARVGNYAGVTVELAEGELDLGPSTGVVTLLDVPGTYSLTARSREEQVAIECLLGLSGAPRPDLVVCCVDATNLSRNLYLVLQARELGLNLVVALTMVDEVERDALPIAELRAWLECPVVPIIARSGEGLPELKAALVTALTHTPSPPKLLFTPSARLEGQIARVRAALPANWPASDALSLWALMSIAPNDELDVPAALRAAVLREVPTDEVGAEIDDECVGARYALLDQRLPQLGLSPAKRRFTERLDAVLIHPLWGGVAFIAINLVMFQALFSWSQPAIEVIETVFQYFQSGLTQLLGTNLFSALLSEGVVGGAGSVVVFLPQILLLFFFLGLMENSGYMARVAYLMDRIMKSMSLHGRAFVPMMSGFACAVPAILATRTMERQRDRLLTMMVVPLMTCSARLPVYTLIIGALFEPNLRVLGIPVQVGLIVFMYLFSTVTALAAAWVMSKTILPSHESALILELPPYRLPRLSDVARMMLSRARTFLREAGTVIVACSVALWFLLNFPRPPAAEIAELDDDARAAEVLNASLGGQLGHALEPAIRPLGFDWKMGVGIIGAFAAREVFVATMGVLYSAGDVADDDASLRDKLRAERQQDGTRTYTPLVGLSLLVFFALACQCMSTLAVVKRETGGYRWPLFLFVYMTSLAWGTSFLVYQGGQLLGFR